MLFRIEWRRDSGSTVWHTYQVVRSQSRADEIAAAGNREYGWMKYRVVVVGGL